MNVCKFKGMLVEKGVSQKYVAHAIGMNRSTFYRKLQEGGESFTISEIELMMVKIPMSREEVINIFLPSLSQANIMCSQGGTQ